MTQDKNGTEISIKEQIKKFAIKGILGFQTVVLFRMGRQLGIFDYLYEKAQTLTSGGRISSVTFTPDEISEKLNLNSRYLDAWLHLAVECGIFEIDGSCDRCLKTASHVYDLLVDRNNISYVGNGIGLFSLMIPFYDYFLEYFKTGQVLSTTSVSDFPEELVSSITKEGHQMSATMGKIVERLFSKYCKEHKRILRNQGTLLEVGCGYGFNLENWAKKNKHARIVGIDIDPKAVEFTKKIVDQNSWNDRIEVMNTTIDEYALANKSKFDVIILNQVLHEMDPDENYRKRVLEDLYTMLKDNGILVVGESMIPGIFAAKEKVQIFEVMHKWLEVVFGSHFYDEKSFKELISSTSFKNVELIRDGYDYFWAVRK